MKVLRNTTIVLCAIFMFAACSSGPEAAAENFQKALMGGDFKEAAKYATKESLPLLDVMANMASKEQLKKMKDEYEGAKLKVISKEINENEATITLEVMMSTDGDADTTKYSLIKEDGIWKVCFRK